MGATMSPEVILASEVRTDYSSFDGILSATEKTVQMALDVIDDTVQAVITDLNGFPDELKNLTTGEIQQLENIGTTTITAGQWGYVGALDQGLATTDTVTFAKMGIGTPTVPHGGIGTAILAIEGLGSTWALGGCHVQFTSTNDNYPSMQISNHSHDNIHIAFDAFVSSGGVWTSSDAGSSFLILKNTDLLRFGAKGGVAQGSSLGSWLVAFQIEPDGDVMFAPAAAYKTYWRTTATYVASLNENYLDLVAGTGVRVSGTLSCAGGTNSERFGDSTTVTGTSSVAIGQGASASYDNCVVVGQSSYVDAAGASVLGRNAHAGVNAIAMGAAAVAGSYGTALGQNCSANTNSVAIGSSASATGNDSISIGFSASDGGFADCIVIGRGGAATAANQMVVGNGDMSILDAYIGKGVVHATPAGLTLQATGGSGTDIAGASFTLAGGKGTGSGAGGSLLFATAPAGAPGASLNSLVTRLTISSTGSASFGATPAFWIDVPNNRAAVGTSSPGAVRFQVGAGAGGVTETLRVLGGTGANASAVLSLFNSGNREGVIAQSSSALYILNTGGLSDYLDATLLAAKGSGLIIGATGTLYCGNDVYVGQLDTKKIYFYDSSVWVGCQADGYVDVSADIFVRTIGHTLLGITAGNNVVVGNQAVVATTATDGFLYIPTCAGVPTGTPTSYTGKVAVIFDTTNDRIYVYDGGWKAVQVT